MSVDRAPAISDLDHGDQLALRMMLSYVEAECLRIGATDAARHAALAAASMPRAAKPVTRGLRPPAPKRRMESLH